MAKAKDWPLVPAAVARSRGSLNTIRTKNGIRFQKWPKGRGKAKQGWRLYQELEFALVASWAANPEPVAYQTAIELAKGTDLVPRDYLMRASYGTYYDVYLEDGTKAESYRVVAPNAQLILDQVTAVPGSILYRAAIGWIGLPPGNNSFVLTMKNGVPLWLPATATGGGVAAITLIDTPGPFTYTIPDNTQTIAVYMVGGGAGGGSGRRTASGVAASGGGGGGGAAAMFTNLRVANLPATLSGNIGAGGPGGPGRTVDSTNGTAGTAGLDTTLTNGVWTLRSAGGSSGNPGTTASCANSSGGGIGRYLGGGGGGCGAGSSGTAGAIITSYGATGGGGGAGMPAVPAARNGAASGSWAPATGYPVQTAAGGVASTLTAPQPGLTLDLDNLVGGGGGGGYVTAAGVAVPGADASLYGGGGGGGAASLNGNISGAGGKGGDGAILFIAW